MAVRRGFVHYATFPDARTAAALDESIGLLLDDGFSVIELSTLLDRVVLESAAQQLTRSGASLYLSGGPEYVRTPLSLCELGQAHRGVALARALELVNAAADLGAENLMLVSGADPGPTRRDAAREALRESIVRIEDEAVRRGVSVTFETFARDRAPAQLLGPTTETLALLEAVSAVRTSVTIDIAHLAQLGEDLVTSTTALKRRSRHMHLSTCVLEPGHPLDGDQHPSFDEPGIAITIEDASDAVRLLGNDAVVSVEIRRHHAENVERFVAQCGAWWDTAVGGAG